MPYTMAKRWISSLSLRKCTAMTSKYPLKQHVASPLPTQTSPGCWLMYHVQVLGLILSVSNRHSDSLFHIYISLQTIAASSGLKLLSPCAFTQLIKKEQSWIFRFLLPSYITYSWHNDENNWQEYAQKGMTPLSRRFGFHPRYPQHPPSQHKTWEVLCFILLYVLHLSLLLNSSYFIWWPTSCSVLIEDERNP